MAQQLNPATRVVYVDIDPVAVAHSRAMLEGESNTAVVRGDLREPEAILAAPEVHRLIDFSEPVGLLIVSVLHFVAESEHPHVVVAQLRDAVGPGSYLAITHAARESRPETERVQEAYQQSAAQGTLRSRPEILEFFGEFVLLEPGLVYLPMWRPDSPDDVDDHPERFVAYAGVGQKP